MDKYERNRFDNAVFFIGACEGLKYEYFDAWLVNHGCKLVIGYYVDISVVTVSKDFEDLTEELTNRPYKALWRTKNAYEAPKSIIKMARELITDHFHPILWIEKRIQNTGRALSGIFHTNMYYWGNPEFFYSGTGSISGKVMYKPDDSDTGKAKDTPCEGATVTAYLYHNKQFVEQKKVKTTSKGEFILVNKNDCRAYAA